MLPLSAFSGIFTYIFGLLFLSEHIAFLPLIGLLVVVIGSYILNAELARESIFKPFTILFSEKESLFYLLSLLIVSGCGVFDKIAIRQSTPAMTILVENIVMLSLLTPYLLAREKNWVTSLKQNSRVLIFNSYIFALVALLVFYAFNDGPIALVVSVKRIQIFFILILSILFLKEKVHKHIWYASLLMAVGVVFIKLG